MCELVLNYFKVLIPIVEGLLCEMRSKRDMYNVTLGSIVIIYFVVRNQNLIF